MPAKGTSKYGVPCSLPSGKMNPEYRRRHNLAYRELKAARRSCRSKRERENELERRRNRPHRYRPLVGMIYSLLRQRDGDTCGICGDFVLPSEQSVDHILPRYQGGTDDAFNLRLAHRLCNFRRPRNAFNKEQQGLGVPIGP